MLNKVKGIKNVKLKVVSILLLMTLMSLQLSPFMLRATATQLQFYSKTIMTPATDVAYNKNVFFSNATLGGQTAYCIDYGRPIPGSTLSYYKQLSAQGVSILVYGYPNTSPAEMGCNSADEAYMATQMAFWTVMEKTGEGQGTRKFNLDNIYAKPGYEGFMQRAAAAAQKLNARAVSNPYLPNPSLTVDTSAAKSETRNGEVITGPYVLNVTGGSVSSIKASLSSAPASARIVDANGNEKTTFANGDSAYVRISDKENAGTLTLNVIADTDKMVGSIYAGDPSAQKFVRLDTVPVELSASVNIKWSAPKGDIEILKVDQNDNKVAGVKFELRDSGNNKVAEGTTGNDGYIRFSNVKPGEYKLVEVSAPEGYIKGDKPIEITVKTGETFKVKVRNEKVSGSLEIIKKDDTSKPVPNVKFEILNKDKNKIAEITTDENGRAKVSNLVPGKYYYREVSAPVNVIMDKTIKEFDITTTNRNVVKTVINEKVKGSLKIIKVDENKNAIPNVTFEILDSNKKVVDTITTNASGIAVSKELLPGTYYYREVSGPSNIIIDQTLREFNVATSGQIVEKTVINKLAKGKLEIVKVDEENVPIAGVKFEILDSNKKVVDTITTDANGKATSKNLTLGKYYYREVEAPAYVIIDRAEYEFNLTSNNQIITKRVTNKLVKGVLYINKLDEKNTPIPGVTFQILDSNKNVVQTIITNEKGIAMSKELSVGTYYYREVSGPPNVIIDNTLYAFRTTETNKVITKTIVNKLVKGKLEIVKVDDTNKPLEGVKFEILDSNKKVVDTIVTNKEGKASSKDLTLGKYYYREVEAPENVVIDTKEYEFNLSSTAKVITKTIVNKLAKGKLEIVKVDDTNKPLEGVKFEILDSDKKVVDTIVTNSEGKAYSKDLLLGTYYYREVEAPENVIIDTKEYEFKLTSNNQVITKRVINKLVEGKLKIIKVDENDRPLEGVTFNILDSNKKVIDTIVTDKNGIAESKELKMGTYYYQEVSAPDGIIVDDTIYEFTISKNGENVIKNIVNKYAKGKLEIVKVDDTNKPLEGVKFEILDSDKKVIDTIVTNSEGKAYSKDLLLGTYYYREVEAPENVVIDTKEYEFSITSNNQVITKRVINKLVEGKLKIIKVDENDRPLEGVTFNILDSNKKVIDTIVTDKNGIAESKELKMGTYYYQEVSAPDGIIVDDTIYEFTISKNGENVIKNIVNKYAKGKLEIVKVDDTNKPLEGVKFEILDSDKKVIDTIVTNSEGKAYSKDLLLGTYYYREVEAPENVVIDTKEYKFSITSNNQVITKRVINKLVEGKLKIIKVDENDKPLEGVTFNILDSNKKVIDTIVTDKNGIAESKELKMGTYYYQEVSAPDGIIVDDTIYEFTISKNGENVIKNIVNKYAKGKLEIVKVDDKNIPIEGVKFEILDSDKKVIDTIVTNSEGKAYSKDLLLGTYYYREIEAPDKYVMDNNVYKFSITSNNQVITKKVINIEKYGNLQILKLDKDTNEPLQGVTFNIIDSNGNIVDTIVTDENGIAVSKNLPIGEYSFYEVSAPDGYIIDDTIYEFKLEIHQEIKEFKIYNEKEKIPVTGGVISTDMMIIILVSLISILGYSIMNFLDYRKDNN